MVLLGIDRSRWNNEPNFAALKAGGVSFVLCKGTDGIGYTDPTFAACRAATEAAGLVFGTYHFAEWGNPTAEATYYLAQCTPKAGELVTLDLEATLPAGVDPVAWAVTFSQHVHAAVGAWPMAYMNQSWLSGHNWGPLVAAGDGLWLAKYDNAVTGGATGNWPALAMKQYSSTANVPGESGAIDADAFQGDLAALQRYSVPGPNPTPPGGTMALTVADLNLLLDTSLDRSSINRPPTTLRQILVWSDNHVDDLMAAIKGVATPKVDQAAADLIAASLVANPDFQKLVGLAAGATTNALEADLAKKLSQP